MATTLRATQPRSIGSPIPAPMDIFRVALPDGVHIPQLAIDRLAAQLANDPKAVAEQFLALLYMAKATDYAVGLHQRATDERNAGHPSLAQAIDKRLTDVLARLDALEDRLDGRVGQSGRLHGKSLEEIRESVAGLLARENV